LQTVSLTSMVQKNATQISSTVNGVNIKQYSSSVTWYTKDPWPEVVVKSWRHILVLTGGNVTIQIETKVDKIEANQKLNYLLQTIKYPFRHLDLIALGINNRCSFTELNILLYLKPIKLPILVSYLFICYFIFKINYFL